MIRIATTEDVPTIGQLWSELAEYHQALDAYMPQPAPDGVSRYQLRIASAIEDEQSQVLVTEQDGHVIGYVIGTIIDLLPDMFVSERAGFLADIYVHVDYRGQGYGRGLVQSLQGWFYARGIQHFEWHVASSNQSALAFWRAMGGQDVMMRMRATTQPDRRDNDSMN